ncbi:sigma 54-interacting transcriptional regulator [Sedimentibacter sp.]|uniref:sigma-54 interaction domain-containing protein n=3 Tax=Sedimentibacter sp. TaxID=1960295 RepID=UPI0028ADB02B|nr:sigma 54-interacting transcriptional regulator [Sedimentibacter sp.]
MELMKNLFNNKGYIDGITIIDLKGEILFTAKFNNKLNSEADENYEVIGKNFLEVYENLDENTSSTYQSMIHGVPFYVENQILKSADRVPIKITSLSIPIKSSSKIVGAIDLSVSEYDNDVKDKIEIDTDLYERNFKSKIAEAASGGKSVNKLDLRESRASFVTENIITDNNRMKELKKYINVAADCNLPTLISGETGTGKEMFAHAIHNESPRKNKPFIAQNCAAIPENLLESILFGTSKGAFTGAVDNIGLLELAEGGTIFLDEVNSMPSHLQSKLLRVLQDSTFRSIGSKEEKVVDVKVIAAINEDPVMAIEKGTMRKDIYYRLSAISFNIPPLRERKDDIPLLTSYIVSKYNKIFNKNIKYVSNNLYKKLYEYDWPGNVRELENVLIYGLSMVNSTSESLKFSDIESKFNYMLNINNESNIKLEPLVTMVDKYESSIIEKVLINTGYNMTKAADILKIPRQTLQRKSKKFNLI